MKLRLKHQRTSNELLLFLKECQKTTGYLSKMRAIDQNELVNDPSRRVSTEVRNMINASILFDNSKDIFESKSCQDYSQIKSSSLTSNSAKRPSTGYRRKSSKNTSSSFFNSDSAKSEDKLAKSSNNFNEKFKDSSKLSMNINTRNIKSAYPSANPKIPLIEHILMNSSSSNNNSSSNSTNGSSKNSNSSRSDSTFSNSSESLTDLGNGKEMFKKVRPITSNVVRDRRKAPVNFTNSTTISNIDWFTTTTLNFEVDMTNNPNLKSLEVEDKPKKKFNEFKSASLNFLVKSNNSLGKTATNSKRASLPINNNNNNASSSSSASCSSASSTTSACINKISEVNTNAFSEYLRLRELNPKPSERNPRKKSLINSLPSQKLPIQVNMSRGSMKKKQLEIMNEYNRYNTLELLNNLRRIQSSLDLKVKQFANRTAEDSND